MKICYVPSLGVGICYWRIENFANQIYRMYQNSDVKVMVEYIFDPRQNIAWDKVCLGYGQTSEDIQLKLNGIFDFFDVVIFQKINNSEALQLIEEMKKDRLEKGANVPVLIAETDDATGDITPSNMRIDTVKQEMNMAAEHFLRSDAVICSTYYLAKEVREIVGHDKPIMVLPNCIDWKTWKYDRKQTVKVSQEDDQHLLKKYKQRIVYVGGAGHDEDLLIGWKAVKPILEDNPDIGFVIRYGGFRPDFLPDILQVDFKTVAWTIQKYPQELYNLYPTVAIAPLRDTHFNRCKSNLKWLEWSSMGVTVVASNVEPFSKTKGDIYLSSNDHEEFQAKIEYALINNIKPEKLIKSNHKKYNLKYYTKNFLKFLKSLCYNKK